jgi:hypothetical protein
MRCLLLTQLNESRVDGMDNDRVSIDHEGMGGVEGDRGEERERARSGTGYAGGGKEGRSKEPRGNGWMDGWDGWMVGGMQVTRAKLPPPKRNTILQEQPYANLCPPSRSRQDALRD